MFSKIEDKAQWKSLLNKALFRTFFHMLEWEDFLERELPWLKFERYIWRDELLLSVARCRFLGSEKLVSHPLCEYGGPLPLKNQSDLAGFTQDFKSKFGEKARIKFHPYLSEVRDCFPAYSQSISTFWIEDFSKKTGDVLWRGLRKTLRLEIKKSYNAGVRVDECGGYDDLKQFYSIYITTVKRHKNIPLPFSVFKFFSGEEVAAKIFIAKHSGRVIGGSVFLFYPPFIHYFISASDYRLRGLNIGHAILWQAMQNYVGCRLCPSVAFGEGGTPHIYDYFDLGGTRKGSALEVFKRGWGAKEYPIYEIGAENAARKASFARDLWGIIPLFVLKRISKPALWLKA